MESITTVRLCDLERRVKALEELMNLDVWGPVHFEQQMVRDYSAHMTKTEAACLLGVCRETVYNMLKDGRLKSAMNGSRVDTRSVARYMNATNQGGTDNEG